MDRMSHEDRRKRREDIVKSAELTGFFGGQDGCN
jgi:hypothetical protein